MAADRVFDSGDRSSSSFQFSSSSDATGEVAARRILTATPIPELQKGNPPANGSFWRQAAEVFLCHMGAEHLLSCDWSGIASMDETLKVNDDPLAQLAAKRAAAKAKKETLKSEHDASTPDVPEGKDDDTDDVAVVSHVSPARTLSSAVFYIDPLTDVVELVPDTCCVG